MLKPKLILDFDRTLVDTFTRSPRGISVEVAYDFAVGKLFGENGTKIYYDQLEGLQNREPLELVTEIIDYARRGGAEIGFDGTIPEAAERLVQLKLECYMPEISPEWPRLFDGVADFFRGTADGTIPANVAIVSSGHDAFIRETFGVNNLIPPDNIVTSDAIRHLSQPQRPLYKPHPYQLARAHHYWTKDEDGFSSEPGGFTGRSKDKPLMMFIGDDHVKDGGLAANSRIIYGHVPNVQADFIPCPDKGQLLIPNFYVLRELLVKNIDRLQETGSLAAVFFDKSDAELFPPLSESERPYMKWLSENGARPLKERF